MKRVRWLIALVALSACALGAIQVLTRARRAPAEERPTLAQPRLTARWAQARVAGRIFVPSASPDRAEEAMARLLAGDSAAAVAKLRAIPEETRTAAEWSDLAAALLTRAEALDDGESIIEAIGAANQALKLDAELAPAHFNRALALERLGLARHARREWVEYLRRESSPAWQDETLRHLGALRVANRTQEARAAFAAARGNDRILASAVRRFPAHFRRATETEMLEEWGKATRRGDDATAATHLAFARTVGEHLRAQSGETLLSDAVAAIDRAASRGDVADLAAAHVLYTEARRTFAEQNAAAAESMLRQAAESFARNGSPMVHVARYYLGGALRAQSRLTEALEVLDALERERLDRRGYHAIAAQLGWERGGCLLERGAISDAIDVFTRSQPALVRLGEHESAAWMDAYLAQALDFAGDTSAAWHPRRRALAALTGSGNERRALVVLQSAATAAVQARSWDVAATLLDVTAAEAADLELGPVVAHASSQLAIVRAREGNEKAALNHLAVARRWLGDRASTDADLAFAEGVVRAHTEPQIAAMLFGRALGFYERAGRRVDIARIYLERARTARRLGRHDDASRDLDAGLRVVAEERAALRDLEQRASLLATAEELFEEAIDLAVDRGDIESAFRVAEASKARMLIEAFELGNDAANAEVEPMPLREIQRALAKDAAVISYASLPNRLVTFVITRQTAVAETTSVTREALAALIGGFSNAVDGGAADMLDRSAAAEAVMIGGVRRHLAGARQIAFVTDRVTSGAPFGALYDRGSRRLLIEDASIVVAPSATLLVTASRRAGERRRDSLLAVGANVFDAAGHPKARPLPNAPVEARRIAGMYTRSTLVTGNEATPRIAALLGQFGIIHYAGHAVPNVERAGRSALLLAPRDGDDGELRLRDIARLRMPNTSLVVLAACQSAHEVARSDGAENLALGFIAAGVPTVVANLWELDDRVSQTLMTELHRRLRENDSPAQAIRNVVLRHARDRTGTIRTPLEWAGLVVVGGSADLIETRGAS